MRQVLRANRGPIVALVVGLGMLAAGVVLYALCGRALLDAMYAGRSLAALNRLISGQHLHPPQVYHREADRLVLGAVGSALILLVLGTSLFLRLAEVPAWRLLWRSGVAQFSVARRAVGAFLREERRLHLAALALICIWGAWVRMHHLGQPMRIDESFTVTQYAMEPLSFSLARYYYPNNHLLHTALVHACLEAIGNRPWIVRLPAFMAGVLLVPATYLAARAGWGRHAALLAAALIAGSSILIEFSANARGYTLVCLFMVLLLALGQRLSRHDSAVDWLLLALCAALGIYTIPILLHAFAIVMLWLLVEARCAAGRRWRPFLVRWAASGAVAGLLALLLYIPVLTLSGLGALAANRFMPRMSPSAYLEAVPRHLADLWRQWHRDLPLPVVALLVAGLVVALFGHRRAARHRVPLLLVALAWLVPVNLVQRVIYITPRIWLYLLPLYLATASAGLVLVLRAVSGRLRPSLRRGCDPALSVAAAALALGLGATVLRSGSILRSDETGAMPDAEPVALFLRAHLRPGDRLVASDEFLVPLLYYLRAHRIGVDISTPASGPIERLVLLVDDHRGESAAGVLSGFTGGGARWPATAARPLRRLGETTIYLLESRAPAP